MSDEAEISVVVADDHPLVREGLVLLLEGEPGMRVVGEATNGQEAVDLAERLRPKVVLLDIIMPVLNGVEAAREIVKRMPETKLLMISSQDDMYRIDEALSTGATGYIAKDCSLMELPNAIREVAAGRPFLCLHTRRRLSLHHR